VPTADSLRLQLAGAEGAILFDTLCEGFTQAHSDQPFTRWDAEYEGWASVLGGLLPAPGVANLPLPLIEPRGTVQVIHYDILGLTYWMLARVEEIGRTDLDNHERFPAVSSHAYKHSYLDRPIVDEWLHLLGQVIQRQWPGVELKRHQFSIKVSHDVDRPSLYAFKPWSTIVRMMVGHIIKRRDLKAFYTAPFIKLFTQNELNGMDPYNTFDWLMDVSEENNLKSAFYFICGKTNQEYDAEYDVNHPVIRSLIRRINQRGHEIGLHPSYATYLDPDLIQQEASKLRQVCLQEGVNRNYWGGRMHYLRWSHPETLKAWEKIEMSYDSTLGYADSPGYRCGTCHEFPAFEPLKQTMLNLRIRPLIFMENSLINNEHSRLGVTQEVQDKISALKESCRKVDGSFVTLWHNCNFLSNNFRTFYKSMIAD